MILLSDEEIERAIVMWGYTEQGFEVLNNVARAQLKKVWDKWDSSAKLAYGNGKYGYDKEWVEEFWKSLLKELENGDR